MTHTYHTQRRTKSQAIHLKITEDGVGISIFGVYNLEFKDNIFDNVALFFSRHGGGADYVTIENNTFKGGNTKAAIQRESGNITYPVHNKISGNRFLYDSTVLLPAQNN